jgi:hypothetical protein
MKPTYNRVAISTLNPHPRNCEIYGDEDVSDLVELIRNSGWVKPLVVTPKHIIISGHRRWKAVCLLEWETVPVEYREFPDELAELEALLLENASRLKTTEQKVREGLAWSEIEKEQARDRQRIAAYLTNQKRRADPQETLRENFPQASKGRTMDAIATRVGFGSGRTYSKAAKVVAVIDSDTQNGNLVSAQGLRKVLNEQSVGSIHTLLKKSPQERSCIANLIATGEAKSTFQAKQMVRQNNYAEFNDPSQATLAEFFMGDWVTVNDKAQSKTFIGLKGQVEQILVVEEQLSVNLEDNFEDAPSRVRFYPHELTLLAKASPPCPYRVGDLIFVDIDRHEAVSPQEKRWNGCWGKVTQIGETGSVTVNVGKESLQLVPRDLKLIDAPSSTLRDVVERALRLRGFELDEIEEKMLDVIQRREWFTQRQLIYLENIEKLCLQSLYCHHDTFGKHLEGLHGAEKH